MTSQPCLVIDDDWAEPAPRAALAYLVQVDPIGEGLAARHALEGGTMILGRGEDCDVFIDDPSVSRLHARIGTRGDRFYVHDLHSTNGTCVNESRPPCASQARRPPSPRRSRLSLRGATRVAGRPADVAESVRFRLPCKAASDGASLAALA